MRPVAVKPRSVVSRRAPDVVVAKLQAPPKAPAKTVRTAKTVGAPPKRATVRRPAKPGTSDTKKPKSSQWYFNLTGFPFPIGPFFTRKTVRREIVKGTIWTFEQTQALELFNVYTPVRMTVIKLKSGGLWVHAPVAPTDECIALLKELDAPVEYIVLPTFAYEHKVFVGPFSRKFPKAQVYVTPFQWSFPLNLPPQFFGIFPAGELRSDDSDVPWADEIEQKLFLPPSIGVGSYVRFSEVAFFHKATQSLLVTDAVVYVDDDPPEVIPDEALLDLARDNFLAQFIAGDLSRDEVKEIANPGPAPDTPESRRRGWKRMSLLVLYFGPGNLLQPDESFSAISNRLFVGPVVETLVYSKVPRAVAEWVDDICESWNFKQIIPCHFSAPIRAGPKEFKRAFTFAFDAIKGDEEEAPVEPEKPAFSLPFFSNFLAKPEPATKPVEFPEADMKTLNTLNNLLLKTGAVVADAEAQEAPTS